NNNYYKLNDLLAPTAFADPFFEQHDDGIGQSDDYAANECGCDCLFPSLFLSDNHQDASVDHHDYDDAARNPDDVIDQAGDDPGDPINQAFKLAAMAARTLGKSRRDEGSECGK